MPRTLKYLLYATTLSLLLGAAVHDTSRQRTSVARLRTGPQGERNSTIWIRAGTVRVLHLAAGNARLRGTHLEGRSAATKDLALDWPIDGEYTVEVSGKYQHRVLGAVVGSDELTSTLTYEELPDSARH